MANKWLTHVKATMKAHKGMKFGQVLKLARKSYTPMKGGSEGGVAAAPEPGAGGAFSEAAAAGGRRRSRRGRKSRRGTRRG